MAMATRPRTPSQDVCSPASPTVHSNNPYGSVPGSRPNSFVATNSIQPSDFQVRIGANEPPSAPHQSRFREELSRRSSSLLGSHNHIMGDAPRNDSQVSFSQQGLPARTSTLKKKGSLRRAGSKRSSRAGSVRSLKLGEKEKYGMGENEMDSAFYVPIPTKGTPTELLANRFQAWRKVLKDLITVFRDIQRSYETRAKLLLSASNAMNNIVMPPTFLQSGGIAEATNIMKTYHKQALLECNKAKEVETEITVQLNSLRNDLQQKIKEIKGLAGDFKNSVDKEMESTRKAVRNLHEALGLVDTDPSATSGKGDPFIIKLGVDRQLEKQLSEENYLHRKAYLNLESSGRELESIVVGEIQKAYSAYASILKRDADSAYEAAERLREGPISMPKDREWGAFVAQNDQLIDSSVPLRNIRNITYPGSDHPAAAEVRAGMLERKSKYLKSYTPGWYILSPTHLHEFKSADRLRSQNPVMSLYLPEQKLGSHSQPDSSSHKFMLKGRQTGSMHRGHAWVFRAESHDTMLAWYEDIKNLTEKTGEARNAFVRKHVRSFSGASYRAASISSDGVLDEDEADATPYSADQMLPTRGASLDEPRWRSPPGGRFPSEVQVNRTSEVPEFRSGESSPRNRHGTMPEPSSLEAGIYFTGQQHQQRPQPQSHIHETEDAIQTNARSASVRSTQSKRPTRIYDAWITTQAPQTPSYDHNNNSAITPNQISTPTPQLSRNGTRLRSIALSTGAPIVVPETAPNEEQQEPEGSLLSTQPTGTDTKTNPSLTTAATSLGALENDIPAAYSKPLLPNGTGPIADSCVANDTSIADVAAGGTRRPPLMNAAANRTLTVSDLKVPGEYPNTSS
ncbi:phosphatidylinositol 4,5-bisphosphate-binding protein [Emydomyces testavorans]|uniref:Phosphatidylinositol 4,5-bisphosphate-binding protein n=1 Tax=Emydomyces testavorans TaxID=2070801 RepID=A0AAF0DL16_9EURO|nr:phosphatidylinositol 4,5-bisphosphate-binding protein [Emydomyces testavorans]